MQASTSSALTWMIGTSKPFARSDAQRVERAVVGIGREADLVVGDQVQRAADAVAVERLEVERLGDDALAGERGVAVDHDRHRARRVALGSGAPSRVLCAARVAPITTGATNSRCDGFDSRLTRIDSPDSST